MKNKLIEFAKNKKTPYIILSVMIILQIWNICGDFVYEKKLTHCDEIYSYGLSNSFYRAYVEREGVHLFDYENVDKWVSGDINKNYLTVQPGEQFRYDSVWHNQSMDRHPPLFYAVLHTVCSFFPDSISFWYGLIPNLLFFAITQFFLYKLAKNILKSKYLALLSCFFYGFTYAAINNTLFIRMYCMLTMWTVIFMYLHTKLYNSENQPMYKILLPMTLVTASGALTQYLFLFVAFVTAVCFCIYFLIKKHIKKFLAYGFSVLGGVLIAVAVYPSLIVHLFAENEHSVRANISEQITVLFRLFSMDVFSLKESDGVWLAVFLPPFIGILFVLSLPVIFLFRNNKSVTSFLKKIKDKIKKIPQKIKNLRIKNILILLSKPDPAMIAIFFSCAAIMLIVAYTIPLTMGYVDRYLLIIYPLGFLFIFTLIYYIIRKLRAAKIIMTVLSLLCIVHIAFTPALMKCWTEENDINIRELFNGSDIILVMPSEDEYLRLSAYAYVLSEAKNVYNTCYEKCGYLKDIDKIADTGTGAPMYIMVSVRNTDDDISSVYADTDNGNIYPEKTLSEYCTSHKPEYKGSYSFFQGTFLIYRLSKT